MVLVTHGAPQGHSMAEHTIKYRHKKRRGKNRMFGALRSITML